MSRIFLTLVLCVPVCAGEVDHITTAMPSTHEVRVDGRLLVTPAMVGEWIQKWQKLLALDDWKIQGRVVRAWELPENAVADIHWSLTNKKAIVKVMSPADSTMSESEIVDDTELSVIHELLHLSMAKLPLDDKHTECEEETVKKLSIALQKLDSARRSEATHELAAK